MMLSSWYSDAPTDRVISLPDHVDADRAASVVVHPFFAATLPPGRDGALGHLLSLGQLRSLGISS